MATKAQIIDDATVYANYKEHAEILKRQMELLWWAHPATLEATTECLEAWNTYQQAAEARDKLRKNLIATLLENF